jgi:hypothetical protein
MNLHYNQNYTKEQTAHVLETIKDRVGENHFLRHYRKHSRNTNYSRHSVVNIPLHLIFL